jgi:hypothetical protein
MNPGKADPAIYQGLRGNVFNMQLHSPDDGVQLVLMDWHVANGTASVLASIDGTASVYLSSGGGFLGGGQRHAALRDTAIRANQLATTLLPQARVTETFNLPPKEDVYFYLRSRTGIFLAEAKESKLRDGSAPFAKLGGLMQQIITIYRQTSRQK